MTESIYAPYNFNVGFFREAFQENELWYDPKVIHFVYTIPKPWMLVNHLIKAKVIKIGEQRTIDEIFELATKVKYFEVNEEHHFKHLTLIEPSMIPFFEYWFEINNLVQIELSEMFG